MGYGFPLNDRFIRFDGETAVATVADSLSLGGGNRIHVTLDCFVDALPVSTVHLAGKTATADWEFTLSAAGLVTFTSRRSGGNASGVTTSSLALVAGRRYVLEGVDDGAHVTVYVNGVAGATVGTVAAGGIVADTTAFTIAGAVISLAVYAFQVIRDEICVCRLYPRSVRGDAPTTIPDTSGWGNNAVITGTEGTTILVGTSTQYEPVYPGSMTL